MYYKYRLSYVDKQIYWWLQQKQEKQINIKKGQFLSAESMQFAAQKVIDSGNPNVAITDRGTMFGYQDLIVDMRADSCSTKFRTSL